MIAGFLASAGLRWFAGEALELFKNHQAHKAEIELLRLQEENKQRDHERQQTAMRAAAEAGLREIAVRGEDLRETIEAFGHLTATQGTTNITGDVLTDRMNGLVRPLAAYACLLLIVMNAVAPSHIVLIPFTLELCSSVLGVFVGGRIKLTNR